MTSKKRDEKKVPDHCCPIDVGWETVKRNSDLRFRWLSSIRDMNFAQFFQVVARWGWLDAFAAEAAPTLLIRTANVELRLRVYGTAVISFVLMVVDE